MGKAIAEQSIWSGGIAGRDNPGFSIPTEIQLYLRDAFWPLTKSSIAEYAKYFKYFQWSIAVLPWPDKYIDKEHFAVQSYFDLTKVVNCLKQKADCSRASIALELRSEFPRCSEAQLLRSMDLAVRLWLMVNVRSSDFPIGPGFTYISELSWSQQMSLNDVISDAFPPDFLPDDYPDTAIDPTFTVNNLRKLSRIKIQWTGNLKDHLKYDRAGATLYLFPHKICLISHLQSNEVLPKDLILDTIKTLDLFFPLGEESTHKYLDDVGQSFHRTTFRDLTRATTFEEFRYWRKRLIDLHDVYHEAPRDVVQMWRDRRNPIQWWTFWLAVAITVMTIIFGIIASYTGFKQVRIAQKSLDLAVWQACSQSDPPSIFCPT